MEAITQGEFHIWAVSTVSEEIELLTGMPAGDRQEDGAYPEGSLFHLVQKSLEVMGERIRQFGVPGRDGQGSAAAEELVSESQERERNN